MLEVACYSAPATSPWTACWMKSRSSIALWMPRRFARSLRRTPQASVRRRPEREWGRASGQGEAPSSQPPPVQTAVLNRLAHVLGLEVGRPFEVGQGAGDLENPVIRPRGQGEPRDRRAQQRVGAVRHAAEDAD